MINKLLRTGALALALGGTAPALAETAVDAMFIYSARHTMNMADKDLARATLVVTWGVADGKKRVALEFGVINEDFESTTDAYGGELLFSRRVGNQRYNLGVRVRHTDQWSTSSELAYVAEHFGGATDLRGMLGLQGVADNSELRGRSKASVFGLGEVNWYATDNLALTVGLLGDSDGALGGVGGAWRR